MKKFICLFFSLLILPIIVLADSAGPAIIGYEAVIINKDGAKVLNNDTEGIILDYNKKVYVTSEDEDKVFICTKWDSGSCSGNTYEIKASDIAPLKKEISPSDVKGKNNYETTMVKAKVTIIVLNKNGAEISKGPADAYDKKDTVIPYKEVIESEYHLDPGRGGITWCYIDSNGYKGWIDTRSKDFGIAEDEILTFESVDLTDDDKNVIDKVPSETIISKSYRYFSSHYIEYNGKTGFIDFGDEDAVGYKGKDGYVLTFKETNLISGGNSIKTIPLGERIKILYASKEDTYGDFPYHNTYHVKSKYYVEYDGEKGFVSADDVYSLYYEFKPEKIALKEDTKFYELGMYNAESDSEEKIDTFVGKYKVIDTIPQGSTVTIYSESYKYEVETSKTLTINLVSYKGKLGCIVSFENETEEDPLKPNDPTPTPSSEIEEPTPSPNPTTTPSETKRDDSNTKTNKPDTIIITCIVLSVVISLIAIISAILVNKKNKKEYEKKLTEIKKEEEKIDTKEE